MIDAQTEQALTGGGDTFLHYHLQDRIPTHDTLNQLRAVAHAPIISANYTATEQDDILLVSTGSTITLPLAKFGKEFEVVMTGTATVTVNLTSPDLIYGESSVLLEVQGTALRFKAITGGWILI